MRARLAARAGAAQFASAGSEAQSPMASAIGANGGSTLRSTGSSDWADEVAGLVRNASEPVVLVAQSRGGLVISEVAERIPERIGYLVYVSAFMVPNGASLAGTIQSAHSDAPPLFTVDGKGMATVLPEALDRIYSNTPREFVDKARANQCLEPIAAITTPISVTKARFGSVPRAYVEATEDQILPLSLQRSMQSALPCDPVFSIATDHVPPTSAPEELAAYLIEIAELADRQVQAV